MEDQQFRQWLQANQFNPSRKSLAEVVGFGRDCFRNSLISSINDKSMGSLTESGVAENMKAGGSESFLSRLVENSLVTVTVDAEQFTM